MSTVGAILSNTTLSLANDVNDSFAIRKTADQTVTDATLVSDSHLTLSLAVTSAYYFSFQLFTTNSGAAEGLQLCVNGTVGVSSLKAQISIFDDLLNTLVGFGRITAFASAVGAALSSGSNFSVISGVIETSTAGTFLLQFAQNAVGLGAGVTVQKNSSLTLRKLDA